RNPMGPDCGDVMSGLACDHALTRSVRDSAALLDATSGPDLGDPYWAPPPSRPFLQEVGSDPGRLRIGFTTTAATGVPVDPDYLTALQELQQVSRQVATYFVDVDVWLTPTLAEPPPPLGSFDGPPDNPMFGFFRSALFVPFTPIANITGQPAMSVPLHWNDAGLPIGSHFI